MWSFLRAFPYIYAFMHHSILSRDTEMHSWSRYREQETVQCSTFSIVVPPPRGESTQWLPFFSGFKVVGIAPQFPNQKSWCVRSSLSQRHFRTMSLAPTFLRIHGTRTCKQTDGERAGLKHDGSDVSDTEIPHLTTNYMTMGKMMILSGPQLPQS